MYCSYCGQENDEGAKFCTKCGKDLLGESLNPIYEQDYQARQSQQSSPAQHGKGIAICALIFGILGGFLGIVFGVIGVAGYYKKGTSEYTMSLVGLILALVGMALSIILSSTGILNEIYGSLGI